MASLYTIKEVKQSLNELSEEHKESWAYFVGRLKKNRGEQYVAKMLDKIKKAIEENWLGTHNDPRYASKPRGKDIELFNHDYPEYLQYIQSALKAHYHSTTVKLYRGLYGRTEEVAHLVATEGTSELARIALAIHPVTLGRHKGHSYFSWSSNHEVGRGFSYVWKAADYVGVFLEAADVPIASVVWCGLPVENLAEGDFVVGSEFVVDHGRRPVEARVIETNLQKKSGNTLFFKSGFKAEWLPKEHRLAVTKP